MTRNRRLIILLAGALAGGLAFAGLSARPVAVILWKALSDVVGYLMGLNGLDQSRNRLRPCSPAGLDAWISWAALVLAVPAVVLGVRTARRLRSGWWTAAGGATTAAVLVGLLSLGPLDIMVERHCWSSCLAGHSRGCGNIARSSIDVGPLEAICDRGNAASCGALAFLGRTDAVRSRSCDRFLRIIGATDAGVPPPGLPPELLNITMALEGFCPPR